MMCCVTLVSAAGSINGEPRCIAFGGISVDEAINREVGSRREATAKFIVTTMACQSKV
jgi:hypothetical protein